MASNKDTKKASTESQVKPLTGMTEREAMQRIQALSRRISEAKRQEEASNNIPQKTNPLEEKQSQIDWSVLDKEIDWDLLDELDLQEEGQHLPMQDYQGQQDKASLDNSSEEDKGMLRQKIMIDPNQYPKLK